MGPEIIPAILAKDEKDLRHRIEAVTDLVETVQIDVMDGAFVPNVSFADPLRIREMTLPMAFEVHLMVKDPEAQLGDWSRAGCERALVHAESVDDLGAAIEAVRSFGMEAGISINPGTSVDEIAAHVDAVDVVQVMGVDPGFMGQEFQPVATEKVRDLRERWPDLIVEVDGGVSEENARELAEAGADRLVSGSYIFGTGAPEKMIARLEDLTELDDEGTEDN